MFSSLKSVVKLSLFSISLLEPLPSSHIQAVSHGYDLQYRVQTTSDCIDLKASHTLYREAETHVSNRARGVYNRFQLKTEDPQSATNAAGQTEERLNSQTTRLYYVCVHLLDRGGGKLRPKQQFQMQCLTSIQVAVHYIQQLHVCPLRLEISVESSSIR